MKTLYIIGNGFDISHGLNSRYSDFGSYVRCNKPNVYDSIDKYLQISDDWSDFEAALEFLDVDYLTDEASNFLVSYGDDDWSDLYHHAYQGYIDDVVETLSEELYECFSTWISSVEDGIDTDKMKFLNINTNSKFLSFNYTHTLEEVYGVENVNHIHGSVGDEKLILGHAWSYSKPIRTDEENDNRINEGIEILNDYFGKTFKNCSVVIDENKKFFQNLYDVSNIVILGHSMGAVDEPYFKLIKESVMSNTVWHCSFYGVEDLNRKRNAFKRIGIIDPVLGSLEEIAEKGFL